jgi:hypothetical protein
MELKPPVVPKAVEFLIHIVVVAVVEPKRFVLGVASRRHAQRLVADWTECAPDPGELLSDGRSTPLDVNVITPVAVVALWKWGSVPEVSQHTSYVVSRARIRSPPLKNSPMHHHISSG